MPLGYDPFDFRRYLPPEASLYTMPVSADGSAPSFTSPVPAAPDVPVRRVPTTPAAPVVVPEPVPSPMAPRLPEMTLSPDDRNVPFSRKVPEVRTPLAGAMPDLRLVPTAASTAPPVDTWQQRLAKIAQGDDMSGAAKAISGAFKKPTAPAVYKMSGSSGGGGGIKDLSGSGQQMLANIMKGRKGEAGELGGDKKRRRAQDRFARLPGER